MNKLPPIRTPDPARGRRQPGSGGDFEAWERWLSQNRALRG